MVVECEYDCKLNQFAVCIAVSKVEHVTTVVITCVCVWLQECEYSGVNDSVWVFYIKPYNLMTNIAI